MLFVRRSLALKKYDVAIADDLFRCLRKMLGRSLQVMLDSCDTQQAQYLIAGGFEKARRCYEMQVSADEQMLTEFGDIFFECDDCDPAAMVLRSFFDLPNASYCDTYILD